VAVPEAIQEAAYGAPFPATARAGARSRRLAALSWAVVASTLHRVRRGEGALLAVNLSLIAFHNSSLARGLAQAIVSVLAIGVMYALNDLLDAPADWKNPKKDRTVIAAYVEHRRAGFLAIGVLKLLTLAIAFATLGPAATAAVAGVMSVNLVYSVVLKGVPVLDVAWVWLWGVLYAAIVETSTPLLVVVGLMTAVCHLFQTLDDRLPDAANGIRTTAVRSPLLARNVLVVLSLLLFVSLYAPFGGALALTTFTPLALFYAAGNPGTGWLLTKAYFGVVWLFLLGISGAAG
jgi:4-hydroxybenzoate polyprenyltransferase